MYVFSLSPQIFTPQQKQSCLHPVLRQETAGAAWSTALSVGQAGRVLTMASPTLITLALPCLQCTSVSPWRDGPKCSTGLVTAWISSQLFFSFNLFIKNVKMFLKCNEQNILFVSDQELSFRLMMPWEMNGPGSTSFPSFCWVPSLCLIWFWACSVGKPYIYIFSF